MLEENQGEIKERIANGDERSYELLFKDVYPSLKRFANSLLQEPDLSEEIASDVLLTIWIQRDRLQAIKNLRAYLYTATKNKCLTALKKRHDIVSIDEIAPVIQFQTPETRLLSSELLKKIEIEIQRLPARCKLCFMLIKEEGLSYKEVAEILNISVKTVDAQMVIAIKRLTGVLSPALK